MKLGLGSPSILLASLSSLFVLVSLSVPARADGSQEDALADGDIDVEDIATRSPFPSSTLGRATGPHGVLGAAGTGSTYLSLVGFSRRTIDDRRELGGFLVLGLPLDRFGAGGRIALDRSPQPREPLIPQLTSSPEAPALRPAAATDAAPFELALTPRLARACVAAAWRAAGLGIDDARLDAILSRARWSAALPEARLRAVRFEDARLSLDTGTDTSRLRDATGANVGFEARLTWRLDRLVYADDEPSFERIRLEHRDARTRIGGKVLEALFHWQRAALDLRTLAPSQQGTRDEAEATLRLIEAEAALDVLTSGWFGASRVRRGGGGGGPLRRGDGGPPQTRDLAPGDL
jgi:hypothetical protein